MNIQSRMQISLRHRTGGFSLIELLVAVTLGLLLISAVGSIYLGSSQSYRTQTGVSQVQEEGRFANLLVVPVVRNAGYLPNPLTQTDPANYYVSSAHISKRAVFGIDNVSGTSTVAPIGGFDQTKVLPSTDVLIVSYIGKNTTAPADSPLRTCLGNDIADDTKMAVNVFYVRNDDTGTPSLYCSYNVSNVADPTDSAANINSTQPLVAGVRDMQILYGIDTDNNFDADYYVKAGAVTDWTRVASIQITFTVDSVDATEVGRTATNVTNGRITHTFSTTIQIRNRLHV